jgi:transcriptional regulator with XRE-family HTH domain
MTPEQCRAARALLGWPEWKLAHRAGCSVRTVKSLEAEGRRPRASTLAAIRQALEDAGVEFTNNDKGETEVRLGNTAG